MEEQRRRQQPLIPTTTAMQESTHNNQTVFTQANIQTRPPTTTSNMLQHTHHQGVTPLWVTSSTIHTVQQHNTPTRIQRTSHLSRHSTPIQQRTNSTKVPVASVLSTVLKPTGAPSRVNHQMVRQNIHWDSLVDTEFMSQDTRMTGRQGMVTNETHMNLSSN